MTVRSMVMYIFFVSQTLNVIIVLCVFLGFLQIVAAFFGHIFVQIVDVERENSCGAHCLLENMSGHWRREKWGREFALHSDVKYVWIQCLINLNYPNRRHFSAKQIFALYSQHGHRFAYHIAYIKSPHQNNLKKEKHLKHIVTPRISPKHQTARRMVCFFLSKKKPIHVDLVHRIPVITVYSFIAVDMDI